MSPEEIKEFEKLKAQAERRRTYHRERYRRMKAGLALFDQSQTASEAEGEKT